MVILDAPVQGDGGLVALVEALISPDGADEVAAMAANHAAMAVGAQFLNLAVFEPATNRVRTVLPLHRPRHGGAVIGVPDQRGHPAVRRDPHRCARAARVESAPSGTATASSSPRPTGPPCAPWPPSRS